LQSESCDRGACRVYQNGTLRELSELHLARGGGLDHAAGVGVRQVVDRNAEPSGVEQVEDLYTELQLVLVAEADVLVKADVEVLDPVGPQRVASHRAEGVVRRLEGRGVVPELGSRIGHLGVADLVGPVEARTAIGAVARAAEVLMRAFLLLELGRLDEAAKLVEKVVTQRKLPAVWLLLAEHAVAREQGSSDAEPLLERILQAVEDPQTTTFDRGWILELTVPLLARHGRQEEALRILTRSADRDVILAPDWHLLNPHLEPLRSDDRFQAALRRARSRAEQGFAILEAARARGELPGYLEASLDEQLR